MTPACAIASGCRSGLATSMASDRHARRRLLPLTLITLGSVLGFLAIFAVWANRQMLDTDNWTETSSELLQDDEVRAQLSNFLVDELYDNVDVQAELERAAPPRLEGLAGQAAGALRPLAVRGVDELLARPRAQAAWEQANRRAHQRLLQVVEDGGGPSVSTAGGNVTLNLTQLLTSISEQLGVGRRVVDQLPANAAQLTVLQSDELELAQDAVRYLKALAIALVVLSLGLLAVGVYLARGWRREALRACGLGLIAAGAAALIARSLAGGAVVGLAQTAAVEPALANTWSISTSLLVEAATATVVYGIVIVFAAWLAGPTAWATATRRGLAPFLQEPRFAYGGLGAIVLLLLAWGPTPALRKPLPALLLIALLVLGVEALRRKTHREFPHASRAAALSSLRGRLWAMGSGTGRPGTTDGRDQLSELERLAALHERGVLDDAEFESQKARVLA
jgi:Short C-terminal domain